jgi:integrase
MRGHIRKRGNSWAVVVDLGRGDDGKRRQKWNSGFRTKRDAERALNEILNRIGAGGYVDPGRQTVAAYLREWLAAVESTVRPGTWVSYRTNIERHIIPSVGTRELRQLGPLQLNLLYADLLESGRCDGVGGLSPRSVRYVHTILHRALRDAVRWGKLPRNPADLSDPPTSRPPEMRTWTREQLRSFLSTVKGDRLYAAWVLLATTGMRRGELLGLRWSDVDFDAGRAAIRQTLSSVGGKVTFSTPKTAKSRRNIALDVGTVNVLRQHRDSQDKERVIWAEIYADMDLVFCREDGSMLRPDSITRRFHELSKRAGVPAIRLHDVRHSYASLGLAAGTHPKIMAERLGHATVGITLDTYSHVAPALARRAADDLAALILGDGQEHSGNETFAECLQEGPQPFCPAQKSPGGPGRI